MEDGTQNGVSTYHIMHVEADIGDADGHALQVIRKIIKRMQLSKYWKSKADAQRGHHLATTQVVCLGFCNILWTCKSNRYLFIVCMFHIMVTTVVLNLFPPIQQMLWAFG